MARVWKAPRTAETVVNNHLTLGIIRNTYQENRLFYSLFRYDPFTKRHIQVRENLYTSEKMAFVVFKDEIVKAPLSMSIRVARVKVDKCQGVTRFRQVSWNEWKNSPLREKDKR